ncbi:hypothetical protein [Azoarcus sp. KH32C]|uniref:hypothetical protein n=1 Tax=Azoarcus sp. KH32C TaxID=748247 RepID=UPI0002386082|nr:hypothetical protein [Azoarcus sp. KH32C]BAL26196.1 hypothetical protein AZKH_3912 [Azoarcus sp. KH32C]
MNKKLIATMTAAFLLSSSTIVSAQQTEPVTGERGSDMAADLLIVRPIGIIGSVFGAAGFIISLPFTIPSGTVGEAGRAMVVNPLEYTFYRPLGDFYHCGRDRHVCGGGGN